MSNRIGARAATKSVVAIIVATVLAAFVSAKVQLPELAELVVQVEYDDGAREPPAARVEVTPGGLGQVRVHRLARRDGLGRYRLSSGEYEVTVRAAGFISQTKRAQIQATAQNSVRFLLVPGAVIEGRLTGRWGEPVPNIPVFARLVAGSTAAYSPVRQWTDDAGNFRLHSLPAGNWQVCAGLSNQVCYPNDAASTGAAIQLSKGHHYAGLVIPMTDASGRASQAIRVLTGGQVRGVVLDTDGNVLDGIAVLFSGEDRRDRVITNGTGAFEFYAVPVGNYSFELESSHVRLVPDKAGSLKDATAPVRLRAERVGSVSGTLVDEFGDPLQDALVCVFGVEYVSGRRRLVRIDQSFANDRTDDNGAFRLHSLPLQSYYLGTLPKVFAGAGPPIGYTYYPGVARPSGAQPVQLTAGAAAQVLPFGVLGTEVRAIAGSVVTEDGRQVAAGSAVLMPSPDEAFDAFTLSSVRLVESRFRFDGVPPGRYTIQAMTAASGSSSEQLFGSGRIVASAAPDDVTISVSPGYRISGHILSSADSDFKANAVNQIVASAVDYDAWPPFDRATGRVSPDGSFALLGLHGTRFLRLPDASGYVIADVRLTGGASVDAIDMNRDVADVEVTVHRSSVVQGIVLPAAGNDPPVVVVAWSSVPGQLRYPSRRILSTQVGLNGEYSLIGFLPGPYWMTALKSSNSTVLRDPEFLQGLVPSAIRIHVPAPGSIMRQDLQLPKTHR